MHDDRPRKRKAGILIAMGYQLRAPSDGHCIAVAAMFACIFTSPEAVWDRISSASGEAAKCETLHEMGGFTRFHAPGPDSLGQIPPLPPD
jgi:hypothetical protein